MTNEQYTAFDKTFRDFGRSVSLVSGLILMIEFGIRFMGLKKTESVLRRFFRYGITPLTDEQAIITDRYTTIFNIIKQRSSLKGRCLSQSLAMRSLLQKKGIRTELKIGVIMLPNAIQAHAWLEKDGFILNDHPAIISQYTSLPLHSVKSSYKFV
jgi:hypothetical protein